MGCKVCVVLCLRVKCETERRRKEKTIRSNPPPRKPIGRVVVRRSGSRGSFVRVRVRVRVSHLLLLLSPWRTEESGRPPSQQEGLAALARLSEPPPLSSFPTSLPVLSLSQLLLCSIKSREKGRIRCLVLCWGFVWCCRSLPQKKKSKQRRAGRAERKK